MNEADLLALADRCGIAREYFDIWGGHHPTAPATRQALLLAMHFPAQRLATDPASLLAKLPSSPDEDPFSSGAAPMRCYLPEPMREGKRLWGFSVQLYSLRSQRNWGIGDFTDLLKLVELTAAAGGDVVGINPLHALFPDNPALISPYSPSHRGFLNALYIDVEAVPAFASCEAARRRVLAADFQEKLTALRASEYVDYAGVAQVKFEVLRELFEFSRTRPETWLAGFAHWRVSQGEALERFARYEALQAHFRAQDASVWGWPAWPAEYRDPASAAVAAFAAQYATEIDWHAWLQWIADAQLAKVAARARDLGMAIGLYRDLAVGANPGGAEVWHRQEVFALGAHTGAPPDELNLLGQDWGLPPFVPHRLRQAGYVPFIEVLHANMRHAGALRIDHVMGLTRLFWVPQGFPATQGTYVAYPCADMLGLVVQESVRAGCLVIGEDLGTVPDGFRERLGAAGVFSYQPLIFARYPDGNFRLPSDMPAQALVAFATHDLPTVAGFWRGRDLEVRTLLRLFPSEELRRRLVTERDWDRGRLLWALEREGLLPDGVGKDPAQLPELPDSVVEAVHAYLARSRAQIMVVQPEDVFGCVEQINVPGTIDEHPNWQRKLPLPIENWAADERFTRIVARIREAR